MNAAWLDSTRAELERNPRLRLGLLVIGVLVMLYAIAGLSQVRQSMADNYEAQSQKLTRVVRIAHEKGWDTRAHDAEITRKALEAEIPDADSIGLGQATVQGWLRNTLTAIDPKLTVSMGQPVRIDADKPYWKIPAQVSGMLQPRQALQLLRMIESRKELMTVDSIRLTSGRNAALALTVSAYYRVNGESDGNATP